MERAETIEFLAAQILAIVTDHPARVAIDGVDASGKTTLADELAASLHGSGRPILRASIDGFHHPQSVRYRSGPDSPAGYYEDSFDTAALMRNLLDPLGPGGHRVYRRSIFDFRSDKPIRTPLEEASQDAILLLDGVFLLRPALRDCWDYSIFVHANFKNVLERAVKRDAKLLGDAKSVINRYLTRYIPAQKRYLSECDPFKWASIVVDNNIPEKLFIMPPD